MENIEAMNSVIFGTGEYVTGWTGVSGSKSDKALGVVALVHFDLRERGLIGEKIALCGTNGGKFDDIRAHFKDKIQFSPGNTKITKKIQILPKKYKNEKIVASHYHMHAAHGPTDTVPNLFGSQLMSKIFYIYRTYFTNKI